MSGAYPWEDTGPQTLQARPGTGPLPLGQVQAAGLSPRPGGSERVSHSQGLRMLTSALPEASALPVLGSKAHPDRVGATPAMPLAWALAQPHTLEPSP